MAKLRRNQIVRIKGEPEDSINARAMVEAVYSPKEPGGKPRYWVANLNMPFCGTITDIFEEDMLDA